MRISDWGSDVCSSDLFQAVEAQARDDARQIGGRRSDPAIDLFPSKPSILHHIFSLAERAEHSIGQAHEPLTIALEIVEARSLHDSRTCRFSTFLARHLAPPPLLLGSDHPSLRSVTRLDRQMVVEGTSVSVGGDLGGRRIM